MGQSDLSILTSRKMLLMTVILLIISLSVTNLLFAAQKTSALDRTEACIANVKKSLKITNGQEEMWDNFTTVMRDNAEEMEELVKARVDKMKTMNAVEYLKSYSEILDVHAEGMKKSIPHFEKLYAGMTAEQKEDADVLFKCYWHGKYGKSGKK